MNYYNNLFCIISSISIFYGATDIKKVIVNVNNYLPKRIEDAVNRHSSALKDQLKKNPNDGKIINQLGIKYASINYIEEALRLFEKLETIKGWKIKAVINQANCRILLSDNEKAVRLYKVVLLEEPKNESALANLVLLYKQNNDEENAKLYYAKLIALNKEAANQYSYLMENDSVITEREGQPGKKINIQKIKWDNAKPEEK